MTIAVGATRGNHTIDARLGEVGVGEVCRAVDAKLGRTVALKVLPAAVAHDRERLARFEREARASTALNRPHTIEQMGSALSHPATTATGAQRPPFARNEYLR